MLGKSIVSCTAANDRAFLEEKLARIKTGRNEHFDLVFLKKDQYPAYTRLSASPSMSEKGKFNYGLFVVSDVTALKKADDALVESELHYRTIIETSPMAFLCWILKVSYSWEISRLRQCWDMQPPVNWQGKISLIM